MEYERLKGHVLWVAQEKAVLILRDTFHRSVTMEQTRFSELTSLVHVSGVAADMAGQYRRGWRAA